MSGEQLLGVAAIITAILTPLTVIWTVIWTGRSVARKVDEVRHEVVTGNEQTLGQLGMRTETRRAEDIPHADRTAQEQRHVDNDPLSKQEAQS